MKNGHPKIVIFQGGGYDGCFWEWNALVLGEDGKPDKDASLISGGAGRAFCERAEQSVFRAVREDARGNYRANARPFVIRKDDDWKSARSEFHPMLVRAVARKAGLTIACEVCKKEFDATEVYHDGYEGNGGIGVNMLGLKCDECARNEHEKYCSENVWKYEKLADRVAAIQRWNRDGNGDVSIFAARREIAPIPYDYYTCEPELY